LESALARQAKANLHPLLFYTLNFTSPADAGRELELVFFPRERGVYAIDK
jgi:hypothetical protein